MLVNSSSGTSFDVQVFGTSNSRTQVYNGTDHYVKGCLFSCKLASGARVTLSALSNVEVLGLRLTSKGIGSMAMSVNVPTSRPTSCSNGKTGPVGRRPVRISKRQCMKAAMSVKGPRLMVFIGSVRTVSLAIVNPGLRGRPLFPKHVGIRFTRVLKRKGVEVHI